MSFELVRQLQKKAVPVDQACRVLTLSRSGYYAARKRKQAQPAVCHASVQLKAAFAASGRAYGSRRLRTAMATRGFVIGIYRVRRLMRQHGLRSAWKRKFVHTTDSKHALPISPNVCAQGGGLGDGAQHARRPGVQGAATGHRAAPTEAWGVRNDLTRTACRWVRVEICIDGAPPFGDDDVGRDRASLGGFSGAGTVAPSIFRLIRTDFDRIRSRPTDSMP